ncbi:hypothetical protein [Chryseobacterium sp. MP_3.2]|uniref:hypothetical protein n=1 Tax=Chryseobacterium sp. MP_3.2 TaxID=3071712 RepID=UPI002E0C1E39|nr:hypothetical protein [Chryseobacterium sp. MP_3.2]
MKTFFTLLFTMMLMYSANAQNKKETLKWLNKHQKYITIVNPSGYSSENFKLEMTEDYIKAQTKMHGQKHETIMYWSQIKNIMLGLIKEENGYVSLNAEDNGNRAPSITLYLSDYSTEMRDKLTLMANMSGTDVTLQKLDMRGKSLFSN